MITHHMPWALGLLLLAGCTPESGGGSGAPADGATLDGALDAAPTADAAPEPDAAPMDDAALDAEPDAAPEPDLDAAPEPEPDAALEPDAAPMEDEPFSFFVTSLDAMQRLSGSPDGFGGDLGGIEGADGICQTIAVEVGAGHKEWRAFLSVTEGPDGEPIHAIERIGEGPWYDANGRLVAEDIDGLLADDRPAGDPQSVNDLPDEYGVPLSVLGDSHDIPTGSNQAGRLATNDPRDTCHNWTSAADDVFPNRLMCGHSWPRMGGGGRPGRPGGGGMGGAHWISDHTVRGCSPGVNLVQDGPGSGTCIGCGGGYGGIYCFALTP